jgi:hypothetical protein
VAEVSREGEQIKDGSRGTGSEAGTLEAEKLEILVPVIALAKALPGHRKGVRRGESAGGGVSCRVESASESAPSPVNQGEEWDETLGDRGDKIGREILGPIRGDNCDKVRGRGVEVGVDEGPEGRDWDSSPRVLRLELVERHEELLRRPP